MVEGRWDLPAASSVGRVAVRATDRDRLVAFYESVIGLEVRHRTERRTVLGAGDEDLFEVIADPDARERTRSETGLFHTAFRVPSRAALGDALDRIESKWQLSGSADHLVSEALYCSDPEGNGVEVYRDRPRETWPENDDGTVEMVSDPLDMESIRSAAAGESAAPTETTVGHVHLEVSSIPRARAFYADALGFRVRQAMDSSALFLAAGDYHHHLGANTWNRRSDPPAGRGLEWWELAVPGDDLGTVRARLEERGHDVRDVDGGPGLAVDDPNGITLRLRPAE